MTRPVLVDLFCGAGGAAVGYDRAGFEVVGIDHRPQPNYPFRFYQLDWEDGLEAVTARLLDETDPWAIHASPPCQGYSPHVYSLDSKWVPTGGLTEARLIAVVRDRINGWGVPYVIENVMGAMDELMDPTMLCGTMFGLPIQRHRLFESNVPLWPSPGHPACNGVAKKYAEARGWEWRDMSVTGKGRRAGTLQRWAEIMAIAWPMTQREMSEAIPPAYTEWVGATLMGAL